MTPTPCCHADGHHDQVFRGRWRVTAILFPDRVVFIRRQTRLRHMRSGFVLRMKDIGIIRYRRPTRLFAGYVDLAICYDMSLWRRHSDMARRQVVRKRHNIAFGWRQRASQEEFIAAVMAARRKIREKQHDDDHTQEDQVPPADRPDRADRSHSGADGDPEADRPEGHLGHDR